MKLGRRKWFVFVATVVAALAYFTSLAEAVETTAVATSSRRATLATFAGTWLGHTRQLIITRGGKATERIDNGCCDPIVRVTLTLRRPRGTPRNATVNIRVTTVVVLDESAFSEADPPPYVGQTELLRLKGGVIREPITGINYCNTSAGRKGTCGA